MIRPSLCVGNQCPGTTFITSLLRLVVDAIRRDGKQGTVAFPGKALHRNKDMSAL